MKKQIQQLFILMLGMLVFTSAMAAGKHALWDGTPITVSLPIGQEREVIFPRQIEVNLDGALSTNDIQLTNNDGILYIQAKRLFAKTRLYVHLLQGQDEKTGAPLVEKTVLLDIVPVKDGDTSSLSIVLKTAKQVPEAANAKPQSVVSLTRFAIQSLYAPPRLVNTPDNVRRSAMHSRKTIRLFANPNVMSMPVAMWSDGEHYVTAILVRNLHESREVLSYRDILGNWQSVSFYPRRILAPHGNAKDQTTVFLSSSQPLASVMKGV